MKLVNLKCPNCQSNIEVGDNAKTASCEYCGSTFAIDDNTVKVEVSMPDQEEAGYQFEKGRQRAKAEAAQIPQPVVTVQVEQPKKRKTWLWVLGWIFVFPIPLTILMLNSERTKNINSKARIAIVVIGWLVYLAIGFSGGSGATTNDGTTTSTGTTGNTATATSTIDRGGYKNIDTFIEKFNATSSLKIVNPVEVDNISAKDSGYYRTEYRLPAFENAKGVIAQVEGYGQIDIVSYGSMGYSDIRVYADATDKEQAAVLFEALANVLVSGKDKENIADCVDKIKKNGQSSSLYLGAKYSASYVYDEVYIEANRVSFE